MRTFSFDGRDDRPLGFEIESIYVSLKAISEILKRTESVLNVEIAGRFGSSNDIRIEFQYFGTSYVVWEPFGDNSRYWIGPKNADGTSADADSLEQVFKRYQPPVYRSLLGNLLTLRLCRRNVDHE